MQGPGWGCQLNTATSHGQLDATSSHRLHHQDVENVRARALQHIEQVDHVLKRDEELIDVTQHH